MAKRATQPFRKALPDRGSAWFDKNQIIPDKVAKTLDDGLWYDDKVVAPVAEPHVGKPRVARVVEDAPVEDTPIED
jgi:hypothetical protein